MSLVRIAVEIRPEPLPDRIAGYLADAGLRLDSLARSRPKAFGFVPSDFEQAYRVLEALREAGVVADRFCEWGSGLGVVTGLAALLGFEAYGIEIREDLVEESRRLLEEFRIEAEILQGSFVPETFPVEECLGGGELVTVLSGAGAVDEVDVDIDDFDVVYAFPWPGEEELYFRLFDAHAASQACLVTYHGPNEGFLVQRKVP